MNVSGTPPSPPRERVLVIGASSGIGRCLTEVLLHRGAEVIAAARNADRLANVARELGSEPLSTRTLDARDFEATLEAVGELNREAPLTGLVTLAGAILLKPAHRTSAADWSELVGQNLTSAFSVVRAAGQHLGQSPGRGAAEPGLATASVVLVSTAASQIGLQNHEAVAATKAGIGGLVLSAAATYARKGLRFNAVAPGLTKTPLAGSLASDPRLVEASVKMHPLGRIGEPRDVASAIAWLLDPASSWVTGQVLTVDGGLSTLKVPT